MDFLKRYYNAPGPGVDRDEPRSKGARLFFEIFFQNFGGLIKLNLIFCLFCLPSFIFFVLSLLGFEGNIPALFLLMSLVTALPIGGAMTASFFCITKMLREDPGFLWHDFKRKFKENFTLSIPFGIFYTTIFYTQIYILLILYENIAGRIGFWALAIDLTAVVLASMVAPYIFTQASYLYLDTFKLLKNSLILCFVNTPRSLIGAVQGGFVWALFAFFFPPSMILSPLIPLIAFSLSWLLTLMWTWKPVNDYFNIEKTLRERQALQFTQAPDQNN